MTRFVRALVVVVLVGVLVPSVASPAGAVSQGAGSGPASQTFSSPALPAGNARLVDAALRDLLGRESTAADQAKWVPLLDGALPRGQFAAQIARTTEWAKVVVADLYARILGRSTDPGGLAYWAARLVGGDRTATLAGLLYASAEFYASAGGSIAAYVDAVYQNALGRTPDPAGRAYWIGRLTNGGSRTTIATTFFLTTESNAKRVDALYAHLLNRAPDPAGRAYWANLLVTQDDLALAGLLVGSTEYYTNAQGRTQSASLTTSPGTAVVTRSQVTSLTVAADGSGTVVFPAGVTLPAADGYLVISDPTNPDAGVFAKVVTLTPGPGTSTTIAFTVAGMADVFSTGDLTDTTVPVSPTTTAPVAAAGIIRAVGEDPEPACSTDLKEFSPVLRFNPRKDFHVHWGGGNYDVHAVVNLNVQVGLAATAFVHTACKWSADVLQWDFTIRAVLPPPLPPIPVIIPGHIKFGMYVKVDAAWPGVSLTALRSMPCQVGFTATPAAGVTNLTACGTPTDSWEFDPSKALSGSGSIGFGDDISVSLGPHDKDIIGISAGPEFGFEAAGDNTAKPPTPWWTINGYKQWNGSAYLHLGPVDKSLDLTLGKTSALIAQALTTITTTLPDGSVGKPYTKALEGIGGSLHYTWGASGLPAGLKLDAPSGIISGTPTTVGASTVTVTLHDTTYGSSTTHDIHNTYTLTIASALPLTIATTHIPDAPGEVPYFFALSGTGGLPPYTWAATGLPTGLSLNPATGVISGTPTTVGTSVVHVGLTGTGAAGGAANANLNLAVGGVTQLVSATEFEPCALLSTGAVTCLDPNATPVAWRTADLPKKASAIVAGTYHVCALLVDGTATCWGENYDGQLGSGTTGLLMSAVVPLTGITALAAGIGHTCALLTDGTVRCWGDDRAGQVGDGTQGDANHRRVTPTQVLNLSGATSISAGAYGSCARLTNGTVACWGDAAGLDQPSATPVTLVNPNTKVPFIATAVTGGGGSTCVLLGGGTPWCWGYAQKPFVTPVSIPLSGATAITAGGEHACALLPGGTVTCWGLSNYGELGNGAISNVWSTPVPVSGLTEVTSLAATDSQTCAVRTDGTTRCWGDDRYGQLGDGTTGDANHHQPVPVSPLPQTRPTALAGGFSQNCALLSTGNARCWYLDKDITLSSGAVGAVALSTSGNPYDHTCALMSNSTVKCWGDNSYGQLGNGTTGAATDTPVSVAGISGATAVTAGNDYSCALLGNGTVKCWGANPYGQLGDGTIGDAGNLRLTPVTVKNLTGVVAIAAGGYHTCAVRTSGTVLCWGDDFLGSTVQGPRGLLPVVVPGVAGAVTVTAGFDQSCALLAAGTVKCWGYDTYGQLGDGTTGDLNLNHQRLTAVSVTGLSGATAISAGIGHTCALLSNGTAKCWGLNNKGQVGDGTSGNQRLTATTVTGLTGATSINLGKDFSCATIDNTTAKCWGSNEHHSLGVSETGVTETNTDWRATPTTVIRV